MSTLETDEDYNSGDDEDYVPEGAEDDVEEESGEECEEVAGEEVEANTGRGGKRAAKDGKLKKGKEKVKGEEKEKEVANVDDAWAAMLRKRMQERGETMEEANGEEKNAKNEKEEENTVTDQEENAAEEASSSTMNEERAKGGQEQTPKQTQQQRIKITEVYDFAGDEIKVEREVTAEELEEKKRKEQKAAENLAKRNEAPKRRGGLTGALTLLAKKPKMSVLDKSSRDWEQFKSDNQIKEELVTANRGKEGFVDRMDFLSRTDHREFEKEKALRAATRKPGP